MFLYSNCLYQLKKLSEVLGETSCLKQFLWLVWWKILWMISSTTLPSRTKAIQELKLARKKKTGHRLKIDIVAATNAKLQKNTNIKPQRKLVRSVLAEWTHIFMRQTCSYAIKIVRALLHRTVGPLRWAMSHHPKVKHTFLLQYVRNTKNIGCRFLE